jgi:dUTP pyrophosphatase
LEGTEKPVTVYTDHQNLQYFLTTKVWTHRQIRWAQKLCGFNFKIIYRPGSKGGKPDALSRRPEYRPEEGATHREQQILQPKHFGKYQISVIWGSGSQQLQQGLPQIEKETGIRIQRLSEEARIPTRGSRLAAGHDLYSIEDILIPCNNRALVKIGLAIAVPEGTYGRIAPRSGLATKGISVDAGVIDADYRGEVKVLLVNHNKMDYEVKRGDRIAQLVVERIDDQDWMEVEGLDETERAGKGFGSSGSGVELKEVQPTICFLQADGDHQFYDASDVNQHPILRKGQVLLSNAIIAKANLRKFEEDFLATVRKAAEGDENWTLRLKELESMKEKEKEMPKQWSISDDLLYYKDRLFIPNNEDLQTLIAKQCHDSRIAGHFGQEKTLEIITRDFYWKGITDWVK